MQERTPEQIAKIRAAEEEVSRTQSEARKISRSNLKLSDNFTDRYDTTPAEPTSTIIPSRR